MLGSSSASGFSPTNATLTGSLAGYKARWVVRGFHQRPGIHFGETFSPVVKPATIRTVLTLIALANWPAHQLGVSNAFLHSNIQEHVLCQQPTGFEDQNARATSIICPAPYMASDKLLERGLIASSPTSQHQDSSSPEQTPPSLSSGKATTWRISCTMSMT